MSSPRDVSRLIRRQQGRQFSDRDHLREKSKKGCGRSPAGGRAALGFWPYGVAGADDVAGGVVGEVAVGVAVVGVAVGVLLGVGVGGGAATS